MRLYCKDTTGTAGAPPLRGEVTGTSGHRNTVSSTCSVLPYEASPTNNVPFMPYNPFKVTKVMISMSLVRKLKPREAEGLIRVTSSSRQNTALQTQAQMRTRQFFT